MIGSEISLGEAGKTDALLITEDGLPVIMEVKLGKNRESRREVVAQAIDYLSALTEFQFDELDERVGGKLIGALQTFAEGDDARLEGLQDTVRKNLRDGVARIIVVVDQASPGLERIFRYLARNSELDVQLISIERYASKEGAYSGGIFVPRMIVNPASETTIPRRTQAMSSKTMEQLLDECSNDAAKAFFTSRLAMKRNSRGNALAYEQGPKIHWYVTPIRSGARVTQIDRFADDVDFWGERHLTAPDVTPLRKGEGSNLRFDLIDQNDFEFFMQAVEKSPPREWVKIPI